MGQFILSSSQNFQMLNSITQSLAGRVALFKLLLFDFTELTDSNLMGTSYLDSIVKGFYPALFDRKIPASDFYANYLETYIERDVTKLIQLKETRRFRDFITICASRVGQLINLSSLANECNISQPTAKSWLSILESSYIIFQLPPYYRNFGKRIVKAPKIYFYDTGLLCHILSIRDPQVLIENPLKGSIFENLVVAELKKRNAHQYLHHDFYFWRDSNGNEVDLIIPAVQGTYIYEVKASETIISKHLKGLNYFQEMAEGEILSKKLIYGGNENEERTNYEIMSWQSLNLPQ